MIITDEFEKWGRYAASETKAQIENVILRHCKVVNVKWKQKETTPPWYKLRRAESYSVGTVLL